MANDEMAVALATATANLQLDEKDEVGGRGGPLVPFKVKGEFLRLVGGLFGAILERDFERCEAKIESLKEFEGRWGWADMYYTQWIQAERIKGTLILCVLKGDRDTFTSQLDALKEVYKYSMGRGYPSCVEITLTRLNLVKALLLDEEERFPAEVEFIVDAHWGIFKKVTSDLGWFKASDVVNFLSTGSMEGCGGSQPPNNNGLQDIIRRCVTKLNVYIKQKSLPWEMNKEGLLVSRAEEEESLKQVQMRHVINEALAFLVATGGSADGEDVPNAVFDNLYSLVIGRIKSLKTR